MPDPSDIRSAYAEYIKDELYELDPDFGTLKTVTRYRNFRDASRATRKRIMGDDFFYMDVLPADEGTTVTDRDPGGVYHLVAHAMTARIFHRYRDADSAGESSQYRFDRIADAVIRATAATDGGVRTSGLIDTHQLRQPEDTPPTFGEVVITLGPGSADDDLAHMLTINITLMENSRSSAG